MLSDLLQDVSLFRILHQIDLGLAESCRQAWCPYSQGALHYASYLRKPRGVPEKIPEEYLIRYSLCCGREGCCRRVLPPSCLFMGRRVYWHAVIRVVMTLRQSRSNGMGANQLMRMFSIPRKTIVRWTSYFQKNLRQAESVCDYAAGLMVQSAMEICPVVWLNILFLFAVQPREDWWPACNFWLRVRYREGGLSVIMIFFPNIA
jgi:hypothetical protein